MSDEGWEFRFFPDKGLRNLTQMAQSLVECDLVYQIGGRLTVGKFLFASKLCRKKKIVMHWAGSDAVDERENAAQGKSEPWICRDLIHWAEADWIQEEVRGLGLSCDLHPLPSLHIPETPVCLPKEFSVLVHMPDSRRAELYGLDRILAVARKLPHVSFVLVGLKHGLIQDPPPNLRIYNRVGNIGEFYKNASVFWRPVRHDGLSFMVREALGYGRHVLWTYEFPHCMAVPTVESAIAAIEDLRQLNEVKQLGINEKGARFVAEKYGTQVVRQQIQNKLEAILAS